jgi:hypothetical protein
VPTPLKISRVRFKANKMPRFDFTHQGVQYAGKPGWAVVDVALRATGPIKPWSWSTDVPFPESMALKIQAGLLPGSSLVGVGLKGTALDEMLVQVRANALTNRLVVVATLGQLKSILSPYFDVS